MTPQRIRAITKKETLLVESLLLAYALHPASANMPWHGKTSLRGTCAIGAVALANRLRNLGLEATPIFGDYTGPQPHHIKDPKHCWVVCHNGNTEAGIFLCDPTFRQFSPTGKTLSPPITTLKKSCQLGFIPKSQPKKFAFWPSHCHPFAKNAMGTNHQIWLEEIQESWN